MLKVVSAKYESTKSKVYSEWSRYRKEKKKILSRKRISKDIKKQIIASELDLTRQKISSHWNAYKEFKYSKIHKSPFKDFLFVKKLTGTHRETDEGKKFFLFRESYQKVYKAKKGFDVEKLDTIVPKVLQDKKVKGVLVVFEVTSEETGMRQHVSNYITRDLMDIIHERERTVYEYVVERFQAGSTKDYNLKFIYLRIIYKKG